VQALLAASRLLNVHDNSEQEQSALRRIALSVVNWGDDTNRWEWYSDISLVELLSLSGATVSSSGVVAEKRCRLY
jgi:hypothetical protein